MKIGLCVSVVDEDLKALNQTVKKAVPYVDNVVVVFEKRVVMKVVDWCEKRGYDYIQYDDKSEESGDNLIKLMGLRGIEFIVWADSGDVEMNVEALIVENVRKNSFHLKVWGEKEICYYATFGGPAIEKWSPKRMDTGLGGSETAVVRLSSEWTKMGYKVTVFGDPGEDRGEHDGVLYLPWYEFNMNDFFNIFIQWRSVHLAKAARHVKCRRYYLDLHDIYSEELLKPNVYTIDGVMVKSKYHRSLAPTIEDGKFHIIGNGI